MPEAKQRETMAEGMMRIAESISRRKGNFVLAELPGGGDFALAAGSYQAVKTNGGFIVTIKLTRERLVELRDVANELLG
jgi:hypothetical protein